MSSSSGAARSRTPTSERGLEGVASAGAARSTSESDSVTDVMGLFGPDDGAAGFFETSAARLERLETDLLRDSDSVMGLDNSGTPAPRESELQGISESPLPVAAGAASASGSASEELLAEDLEHPAPASPVDALSRSWPHLPDRHWAFKRSCFGSFPKLSADSVY